MIYGFRNLFDNPSVNNDVLLVLKLPKIIAEEKSLQKSHEQVFKVFWFACLLYISMKWIKIENRLSYEDQHSFMRECDGSLYDKAQINEKLPANRNNLLCD